MSTTDATTEASPRSRRSPRKQGTGPTIWIHAAGSWSWESSKIAGYAAIIRNRTAKETTQLSGQLPDGPEVSNIRAEMIAVAEALESLPDNSTVTIWTPSDFLPKAFKRSFRRNANLDIWERLDRQYERHAIKRFHHEPLYYNKPQINEAHTLARKAAEAASNDTISRTKKDLL